VKLFDPIYKRYIVNVALIWAPCFIVLLLIYVFLVRPQSKNRAALESKVSEIKQLYESAQNAARESYRVEMNQKLEKFKGQLKDFVVDERDTADLTFGISKVANEKNVTAFGIKAEDAQSKYNIPGCTNIYEKRIQVDFTSGFNQFAGFLNALERHQPVVFINDFKMSRSSDNPSGHRSSMGLAVLVRKRVE
jgi:Tfp pilus assembly protein PilO